MAKYPPGSMFKLLQSLIGLEEGLVNYDEQLYIDLSNIGDLAPEGYYDLKKQLLSLQIIIFINCLEKL